MTRKTGIVGCILPCLLTSMTLAHANSADMAPASPSSPGFDSSGMTPGYGLRLDPFALDLPVTRTDFSLAATNSADAPPAEDGDLSSRFPLVSDDNAGPPAGVITARSGSEMTRIRIPWSRKTVK